jgi:hypothetical protein
MDVKAQKSLTKADLDALKEAIGKVVPSAPKGPKPTTPPTSEYTR